MFGGNGFVLDVHKDFLGSCPHGCSRLEQEVVGRSCSALGNRLGCTVGKGHCDLGVLLGEEESSWNQESNGSHQDVRWLDLDCTCRDCTGGLGCSYFGYRQTHPRLINC